MEVYWKLIIDIGQQVFMEMEPIPIKKSEIGENDFLSINWKGFEFDVLVLKELNHKMPMMST